MFPPEYDGILMRATLYTMCIVKFTPLSIYPLNGETVSHVPGLSSSLITLILIFKKEFADVPSFLMMFLCMY